VTELTVNEIIDILYEADGAEHLEPYYNYQDFKDNMLNILQFFNCGEELEEDEVRRSGRDTPLTGEEVVRGDLLLFDYYHHDNYASIEKIDSIDDVECAILNEAEFSSHYKSSIVLIEKGEEKKYKYNENNNTVEWID